MYEVLKGKNIVLRKAKEDDFLAMFNNVWSDENVYKWMLFKPTLTINEAIERNKRSIEYQKSNYAYYIAEKSTDEPIGLCAIKNNGDNHYEESGICLARKMQGKGYGKEVLSLLLDLAFNKLNAVDFLYGYFIDNEKSKRLALSFYFKYIETKTLIRPWDKSVKTIDYCKLTKDEYLNKILSLSDF